MWRHLQLPSTLRLDDLHGVLQAVFGWTDSHLHRFSLGDSAWDDGSERFLCPYDVEDGEDDGVPACDVRLDEVLAQPGDHLLYTYDYGDEWNHRLVVEAVGEPMTTVQCLRVVPPNRCRRRARRRSPDRRCTARRAGLQRARRLGTSLTSRYRPAAGTCTTR